MEDIVLEILKESIAVKDRFIRENLPSITACAERPAGCITAGNKIMLFGNGGSAADAQHIAAEFVNRFIIERPPLSALALTTDTSVLTSIGNDYDFDDIFSKQILALGRKDDIAIGISTSGNSPNVVNGIKTAGEQGLYTIGLTGPGGKLGRCADLVFSVDSTATPRIQEAHIILGHILCDLTDRILYPEMFNR